MKKIFKITGASGSGKSSATQRIFLPEQKLITTTSRNPREGERDGVDYYFYSREEFLRKLAFDEFIEHNEFANKYYGLTKEEFYSKIQKNHAYIILDSNGIETYKELFPESISIFIDIDKEESYQNMIARGDSVEKIEERMTKYEKEAAIKPYCDFVIVNRRGQFENTVEELKRIVDFISESD